MPAGVVRQFGLRAGVNEQTDPKQLEPGTLTALLNGVWVKDSRVDKRFGTSAFTKTLVSGGSVSTGARLFTRGDELCLVDGGYLNVWSPAVGKWVRVDQVPDAAVTWRTMIDPYDGVSATDVAYANGLTIHAWTTGDPLNFANQVSAYVQVFDADGEVVMPPTSVSASLHGIRIVVIGTTAHIVFRNSTNIKSRPVDLTTMTIAGASSNLRTDARSISGFDAMAIGSTLVIAYESTIGNTLKLASFTYSGGTYSASTTGAITSETSNDFRCIAIDGAAGEVLYVAYCDRTNGFTRVATANPSTLAQVTAPVTLDTGSSDLNVTVARIDASSAVVGWSWATAVSPARGAFKSQKVSSTLTPAATSLRVTYGARAISRIFTVGSRQFAFVLDYPISNSTTYGGANSCLMEVETSDTSAFGGTPPHRYLGKVDVLIGGLSLQGFLSSGGTVSSTQVQVAVPFLGTAPSNTSNWRCGVRLASVTIGASLPADMWKTVTFAQESYLAGALLHAYDGRLVFDYGFARAPWPGEANTSEPSAGAIDGGTYLYAWMYEYRSAVGVLHRSRIQTSTIPTAGGAGTTDNTNTIALVGTSFTSKMDVGTTSVPAASALIVPHRSAKDGKTYYRWTYEPRYNVTAYDPTAATQTITDTSKDSSLGGSGVALTTRPVLYTTGGILEDYQPPSCLTQNLHRSRLWLVAGDKRTLWFSKSFQDDLGTAPGFHPTFTILMDSDVVAFATMDEKHIILGKDRLWYHLGDGPAPDSTQSDYVAPTQILSDVGCSNPRSVVTFPGGVLFQSVRGLCVLSRGLEVDLVGGLVADTLASFPNITSAVLVAKRSRVMITCNNADASAGRVLVLDYRTGQWSIFAYTDTTGAVANTPIAHACIWNGEWTFVTPTGAVYREDPTTYLDGGSAWVPQSGELAWISEDGPLGFQRIRKAFLLGDRFTDCDLSLSFAFDHDASYLQSYTWKSDAIALFADGANIGMRVGSQNGANPRCRAFRLKWSDATPTGAGAVVGNGRGINLSAVGLEFVPKPGMDRRSARARA